MCVLPIIFFLDRLVRIGTVLTVVIMDVITDYATSALSFSRAWRGLHDFVSCSDLFIASVDVIAPRDSHKYTKH